MADCLADWLNNLHLPFPATLPPCPPVPRSTHSGTQSKVQLCERESLRAQEKRLTGQSQWFTPMPVIVCAVFRFEGRNLLLLRFKAGIWSPSGEMRDRVAWAKFVGKDLTWLLRSQGILKPSVHVPTGVTPSTKLIRCSQDQLTSQTMMEGATTPRRLIARTHPTRYRVRDKILQMGGYFQDTSSSVPSSRHADRCRDTESSWRFSFANQEVENTLMDGAERTKV